MMDWDEISVSDLCDLELVLRMRKTNYEKFASLVRMHLSFDLDLNTDDFDRHTHEIEYEDKGKLKKWHSRTKKHKSAAAGVGSGCAAALGGTSGASSSPKEPIDSKFLLHINELKQFLLLEKNLLEEGIFRKTGSASRQKELRQRIKEEQPPLNLEGGGYSAHDCATVFKGYLKEIPEPLLSDAHYPAHVQIAKLCICNPSTNTCTLTRQPPTAERLKREQRLLNAMQLLMLLLPEQNRSLLQHTIEMLHCVAAQAHINKMSAENLGTLFAPHLICPRDLPPEALHYVAKQMAIIVVYMIRKGPQIFEVPAKLATDCRAYVLERKRRKSMSPAQTLDESISDISTVNTVFTFVDRERTAAAHNTNNTDTELAQLYAHIQSLPESTKKRRLIKQFNKQNGQGTPLQMLEPARSYKSLGDSIKKKIFQKSLMSRTPKRTLAAIPAATTAVCHETPNFSKNKNPKLRVLFQSPASSVGVDSSALCSSVSTSLSCTPAFISPTNSHNLQKSVSSTSLLMNSSTSSSPIKKLHDASNESCCSSLSSDGLSQHNSNARSYSVSAPVSRQTSNELSYANSWSGIPHTHPDVSNASSLTSLNAHTTPRKLISDAANKLLTKKSVVWYESNLVDIKELSNPCTPVAVRQPKSELTPRYKSEPNLSCMLDDYDDDAAQENVNEHESVAAAPSCELTDTPNTKSNSVWLTRKLIKGVSMSNLKLLPFGTSESTKRLVRSVSTTLRRRSSCADSTARLCGQQHFAAASRHAEAVPLLDDLDDEQFQDQPNDDLDSNGSDFDDDEAQNESVQLACASSNSGNSAAGSTTNSMIKHLLLQQRGDLRHNIDLITTTPTMRMARRSMSPITKSTQRMPKAMQESIMTPRSRKPVMVLMGSLDPNQTLCQTDSSDFRELDEVTPKKSQALPIMHNEDATSLDTFSNIMQRKQLLLQEEEDVVEKQQEQQTEKCFTYAFKKYLATRSVSPADLSFKSQSDDDNTLSSSLLYCLDGNEPCKADDSSEQTVETATKENIADQQALEQTAQSNSSENFTQNRLATNYFILMNNARKRAATHEPDKVAAAACLKATPSSSSSSSASPGKTSSSSNGSSSRNKENVETYLRSKKYLISDFPGETSF